MHTCVFVVTSVRAVQSLRPCACMCLRVRSNSLTAIRPSPLPSPLPAIVSFPSRVKERIMVMILSSALCSVLRWSCLTGSTRAATGSPVGWLWVCLRAVWIPKAAPAACFTGSPGRHDPRSVYASGSGRVDLPPFYSDLCNYYGRQRCGFKASQYVDKPRTHWQLFGKPCYQSVYRGNGDDCKPPAQVAAKPSGPAEKHL